MELARRRATSEAGRARVPPPPGPVTYTGVALVAGTAAAYAVNAKSPATQNAYRSDWADFAGWCRSRGYADLPASPQTH